MLRFGASLLFGATLSKASGSGTMDSSSAEYDGECDGYDNAYTWPIERTHDMSESGILDDPALGEDSIPGVYGVDWDVTKAFFCTNDNDDNTRVYFEGYGFPSKVPITAWLVVCPGGGAACPNGVNERTHEIFAQGYADIQIPCQRSDAPYAHGRGLNDPNVIEVDGKDGSFKYYVDLDFDPSRAGQAPMPNKIATVTQAGFPSSIGSGDYVYTSLAQTTYQDSGKMQDIGREFLREYDSNGSPVIDENGFPVLARAPVRFGRISIVGHQDFATHGTDSATFSPLIKSNYLLGDHFPIVWFAFDDIELME